MINFLISWGPLILLLGVWVFMMVRGGVFNYKAYAEQSIKVAQAQLTEMEKTSAILKRIEELLEKRQ